jgi:uncharacterized protein (TIGR00375 family)
MKVIADLHIHSRYSRACSTALSIANLEKWARVKGVNLLGTGDFTHPEWIKELKSTLFDDGTGIYKTKSGFPFMLTTEVSSIYSQDDKGRRVHNVIFAPSLEVVSQITEYFKSKGRVDYDGRPIFKISCRDLIYDLRKISDKIEVIPAHIWTPWFSLFGSNSGFDTLKDAFGDQTQHINALETGMSSDPEMNWRLSQLDGKKLVSFSDSHSFWPWRLGREATIFEMKELTYNNILKSLRGDSGITSTIEVDPGYGKYHIDGHRNCSVEMEPEDAIKHNNICPVCKKPLTLGVAHRVEELADRKLGFKPKNALPFQKIIPLSEILAKAIGKNIATKSVWAVYNKLIESFKSEYNVLLNVSKNNLLKQTPVKIAELIMLNREGLLKVKPGFDGVYGEIVLDSNVKKSNLDNFENELSSNQKSLGKFI